MQALCKNHFLQQVYRKIDGALLWSQNERNLDCVVTFQTHSILQRFMLRFDFLQLDCNDHLYIYDGAHPVGTYKVGFLLCDVVKVEDFSFFPIFDVENAQLKGRTSLRLILLYLFEKKGWARSALATEVKLLAHYLWREISFLYWTKDNFFVGILNKLGQVKHYYCILFKNFNSKMFKSCLKKL